MATPITRRKAATPEEIRLEREVIGSLHVGLVTLGADGSVLDMNRAAMALLGLPAGDPTGRPWREALPPGSVVRDVARRTLRERRAVPEAIGPLGLGEGAGTARCISSLLRDERGEIGAVVIEFHDVTSLVRMEAEVRHLDRLATVGRFASALAHEIRNPLTGIYAGVQFLEKTLPAENDAQTKTYRIIREEVERLNRMVEDMLGSARFPEPRYQEVDPNDLMSKVAALLGENAAKGEVTIVLDADETLPPIRLDPDQICQVLLNLGRNAVEVSPPGTEVTLGTTASTGAPARGMLLPGGSVPGVEFRVRDRGPGIAAAEREKIFEPFQSKKKGGTGLGLYVAFQIVERHGGSLWVRAEEGSGAEFAAWVPYRRPGGERGREASDASG
ncbi:MAG: ATP-binding protein [Candidatus Eisenbacteria bacterium]